MTRILALAVGEHRARFLDQRRAGRLHGDAGEHRAAGVANDAR